MRAIKNGITGEFSDAVWASGIPQKKGWRPLDPSPEGPGTALPKELVDMARMRKDIIKENSAAAGAAKDIPPPPIDAGADDDPTGVKALDEAPKTNPVAETNGRLGQGAGADIDTQDGDAEPGASTPAPDPIPETVTPTPVPVQPTEKKKEDADAGGSDEAPAAKTMERLPESVEELPKTIEGMRALLDRLGIKYYPQYKVNGLTNLWLKHQEQTKD